MALQIVWSQWREMLSWPRHGGHQCWITVKKFVCEITNSQRVLFSEFCAEKPRCPEYVAGLYRIWSGDSLPGPSGSRSGPAPAVSTCQRIMHSRIARPQSTRRFIRRPAKRRTEIPPAARCWSINPSRALSAIGINVVVRLSFVGRESLQSRCWFSRCKRADAKLAGFVAGCQIAQFSNSLVTLSRRQSCLTHAVVMGPIRTVTELSSLTVRIK